MFEEICNRQIFLETFLELVMNSDHQQRMPTEIEEVVINPDLLGLQGFPPNGSNDLLGFISRCLKHCR